VDLYPTVMDLLQCDRPEIRKELQGEPLFPKALPSSRKRAFAVSEIVPKPDLRSYPGYPDFDASVFAHGSTAIRHDGHKLIWSANGKHELYHLTWDPGERGNLYREDSPKAKELRALLEGWEQSSGIFREAPAYSVHGDDAVDEEVKARLKALGYVE
jgi:arylsulfatase A-like enzyme